MPEDGKEALRKEMAARRSCLSARQVTEMSASINERLLSRESIRRARTIALYLAKGNEVQTNQAIIGCLQAGKEVLIPVTRDRSLEFFRFSSFEDLEEGRYRILEPRTLLQPSSAPDAVVVPGLAFGFCMHRVGYGKGFYDRYLAGSGAYRIGLCYEFQLMRRLPSHEHDQRMDEILTEERALSERL